MDKSTMNTGFSERILKEVIATPAMKEIILLLLKDIKPDGAAGLVKTLLWGDPGISMSLFGALPDMLNWLFELLLELGRQLNGLPEPLLKDILGQMGKGIDAERLRELGPVYRQLAARLLFGDDATPEEVRAAVVGAINSVLAGADRLTQRLETDRAEIARSLAQGARELDTASLRRIMRRLGQLSVAAARKPGEKAGAGAPKGAVVGMAVVAALLVLRKVRKKVRG